MIRNAATALGVLVLVNVVWGGGFVVIDRAIDVISVHRFNAFRFALGALCLAPFAMLSGSRRRQTRSGFSRRELWSTGAGLGLILFLGFYTQTAGMLHTTVSNAGFITGLCVPLTPFVAWVIFKRRPTSRVWIGATLATAGLYLLTVTETMAFNRGDVLVTISAVCFAAHICCTAAYAERFPPALLSVIQLGAVATYSALASLAGDGEALWPQLQSPMVWRALIYTALLGTAFAYWAQTTSQRFLAPHQVALVFALEPVFAYLFAHLFHGETLGWRGGIGAALILLGMVCSELGGRLWARGRRLVRASQPPR